MAGYIIPLVSKRVVDFSTLQVGGTQTAILIDRVDTLHWRQLTVVTRVHQHSLASGAGTITIQLIPQSWTREEPGLAFLGDVISQTLIDASTPNPAFLSQGVPTYGAVCLAAMTRVVAVGARTAPGLMTAALSLEFSVKDA